jgi:hypothetical protein
MSESQKTQCCERDDDFDGNCDIHSAPGVYRFGSKETDMIYPTMIAAYGRRPTVTVKEAIFFLIDHNSDEPLRPTELLRDLTTRFIPPYTYSEVQDEISKLLEENVILLTPKLRVVRQKS